MSATKWVLDPTHSELQFKVKHLVISTVTGFFKNRPLWLGITLGGVLRFFCHVLSGVVFFGSFAPEGTNVWMYSAVYNGSFMAPTLVVCGVLAYLIWPRLRRVGAEG